MSETRDQNPFAKFVQPQQKVLEPGNPFARFAPEAQETAGPPFQQPYVSPLETFWEGMQHQAGSSFYGLGQLETRVGHSLGMVSDETKRRADEKVTRYEDQYRASAGVSQHPWAARIGRFAGDAATAVPLMAIPGMGAMTALGRLTAGTALGTVQEVLQPVPQEGEKTQDDFYNQKVWQGLTGAAGGLAGGAVGEAVGSALSRLIVRDAGRSVGMFRRAVQPATERSRMAMSNATVNQQDTRILTAIDQVVMNRRRLQLTDEQGNIVTGQLPRSLRQFGEALDQVRRDVFGLYDGLMRRAGQTQPPIDLRRFAADIRASIQRPGTRISSPGVVQEANALARRLEGQGYMTLQETQDFVQNLNRKNNAFWRNPTRQQTEIAVIEHDLSTALRAEMDRVIQGFAGHGYQELRNTYGALKQVEKDVANAVHREAGRRPGGIDKLISTGVLAHALQAVIHPGHAVRAGAWTVAKEFVRRQNSPNETIKRLFNYREKVLQSHASQLQRVARQVEGRARTGITAAGAAAGAGAAGETRESFVKMLDQ